MFILRCYGDFPTSVQIKIFPINYLPSERRQERTNADLYLAFQILEVATDEADIKSRDLGKDEFKRLLKEKDKKKDEVASDIRTLCEVFGKVKEGDSVRLGCGQYYNNEKKRLVRHKVYADFVQDNTAAGFIWYSKSDVNWRGRPRNTAEFAKKGGGGGAGKGRGGSGWSKGGGRDSNKSLNKSASNAGQKQGGLARAEGGCNANKKPKEDKDNMAMKGGGKGGKSGVVEDGADEDGWKTVAKGSE